MNAGQTIFSQIMDFLPRSEFRRCVNRYHGHYKLKSFSCMDQYLILAFAQLSYRESLHDNEACLCSMPSKLYHMGIRSRVARTTLAKANENRDWRIHADWAQGLITQARALYGNDPLGIELDQTAYAFDSSTIDLCLSLFPWAGFRPSKAAIKLHTLMDIRGNIPVFIQVTPGKTHDVNLLDALVPEPGSIYVMDRGYLDYAHLYRWHPSHAIFVIRAKRNLRFRRLSSRPVDKSGGVPCDQFIQLQGSRSHQEYPDPLRRIRYFDEENHKRLILLTNHFTLPALTIAQLYRSHWPIELFFKWIKQHLRIKAFYGTSENAVKIQIGNAISVYVLVAIIKKQLHLKQSLYTILQVWSVTLLEKRSITPLFSDPGFIPPGETYQEGFPLFDFLETEPDFFSR